MMEVVVISNPDPVPNEASIINALLGDGLTLFHLRKPSYTKKDYIDLALQIEPAHRSRLVLHDHHALGEKIGTHRIHFSERMRLYTPEHDLKKWKIKNFILSTSIHHLNEYASLSAHFDYTFLGPVFESISKSHYAPPPGAFPSLPTAQRSVKIFAIGGITPDKMEIVKQARFDGAAMLGAIWQNPSHAIETLRYASRA